MSWHHGDWLLFAQALVSAIAIGSAFGVVIFQNWGQRKQAHRLAAVFATRAQQTAQEFTMALSIHYDAPGLANAIDVLVDRRASFDRLQLLPLDAATIEQVELVRSSMTKLISVCRRIQAGPAAGPPDQAIKAAEMACEEIARPVSVLNKKR